jgi:hypothetical protein
MSAKQAAIFAATFGGTCGGLLAAGLLQYLAHDSHWLPLLGGAATGALIAAILTTLVTRNLLSDDPRPERPGNNHGHNP